MGTTSYCPECGANLPDGNTCQDYFYQLLYWENEDPVNGEVHHLLVLCYHLQHPSLYSSEGLVNAQEILRQFVEEGVSPADMVKRNRDKVASDKRHWKIKPTAESRGSYPDPIHWSMTTADVIAGGSAHYRDNVRAWGHSTFETLKAGGSGQATRSHDT